MLKIETESKERFDEQMQRVEAMPVDAFLLQWANYHLKTLKVGPLCQHRRLFLQQVVIQATRPMVAPPPPSCSAEPHAWVVSSGLSLTNL